MYYIKIAINHRASVGRYTHSLYTLLVDLIVDLHVHLDITGSHCLCYSIMILVMLFSFKRFYCMTIEYNNCWGAKNYCGQMSYL